MINTLAPELSRSKPGALRVAKLPELRLVIQISSAPTPGTLAFDAVDGRGGDGERQRLARLAKTLQFDEAINIQFTSGTTGLPKGATFTHHNILNDGYFLGETMRT